MVLQNKLCKLILYVLPSLSIYELIIKSEIRSQLRCTSNYAHKEFIALLTPYSFLLFQDKWLNHLKYCFRNEVRILSLLAAYRLRDSRILIRDKNCPIWIFYLLFTLQCSDVGQKEYPTLVRLRRPRLPKAFREMVIHGSLKTASLRGRPNLGRGGDLDSFDAE